MNEHHSVSQTVSHSAYFINRASTQSTIIKILKIKDVTSSCSFSRLEMLTVFCDCDFCVSVCVFFYCCQFCETQNSETDGVFTLQDGDSTSVLCCWKHQR